MGREKRGASMQLPDRSPQPLTCGEGVFWGDEDPVGTPQPCSERANAEAGMHKQPQDRNRASPPLTRAPKQHFLLELSPS